MTSNLTLSRGLFEAWRRQAESVMLVSMIESHRIHSILRYAVAVASGEDDFRRRELGPIHLIKYLYLADLAHAFAQRP